ncbi:MAG: fimbria/pilus outer membrane usher protein [Steroidobacteraceae bacterium]
MRLRSRIAATLLLAAGAPAFAAQGPESMTVEPFAEAVVELHINDQPAPATLVVRRDVDGTLLISAADLATLRLKTPLRGAVQVNGERYYRLGPEMGAVVALDDATMKAQVTVPAQAFLPTRRENIQADTPRATRSAPGAFVNYDVSAEQSGDRRQGGAFLELGLFGNQGVLTSTMVANAEPLQRQVARLDTTWNRDFPDMMATLRVGDSISSPGGWGRAVRFGGVQFGTNFSTQPMLVKTPLLAAHGEAVVPSTVDVFVNGRPVASESVPPGPFSIDHLPVLTGAGQLQVVVTDALGRQQVLTQPYYSGSALLRPGLAEYSVELGSIREDYGERSFAYGDMLGVAMYRRGVTDTLTAGARAEAQANGIYALGAEAAWQAGVAGIVNAQVAAGGDAGGTGFLAGLGIEHNSDRLSAYAQTQYASRAFVQSGMADLTYRPRQRTFAGLGFDFGRHGNMQVAYGLQSYYDSETVQTFGLSYSLSIGALGYLGLFASHAIAGDQDSSLLLNWTVALGDRRTLSASLQQSSGANGGFEARTSLQRDLPAGSGFGYRMSLASTDEQDAYLAYQGSAGTAEIDYARRNGESGVRIGASGGLAVTAAGVMPARPLQQSFAVVQVADYEGLTVYLDNQPVGTTDEQGRVLIDALRPYERNEISVNPRQVPMDGSLSQRAIGVTPAYRSGALVRFPIERAMAATMRLVQADGSPVPAGAEAMFGTARFPIALDGLLYVEGLSDSASMRVTWIGGTCSSDVRRPEGNDPVPDLGDVRCE